MGKFPVLGGHEPWLWKKFRGLLLSHGHEGESASGTVLVAQGKIAGRVGGEWSDGGRESVRDRPRLGLGALSQGCGGDMSSLKE